MPLCSEVMGTQAGGYYYCFREEERSATVRRLLAEDVVQPKPGHYKPVNSIKANTF